MNLCTPASNVMREKGSVQEVRLDDVYSASRAKGVLENL